jgi:hypothetical protein
MVEGVDPVLLRSVPHRAPILRVQRVLAHGGDTAIVLGNEPEGEGALRWELGAIEGLAQSAAALLGHGRDHGAPRAHGMLVAVKRFTVDADPPNGATIHYHVRLVRRLGAMALIAGHAEHDGVRLAAGELTLWLGDAAAT